MSKKPFVLGDDVARALDEIVSINDDLPEDFCGKAKVRAAEEGEKRTCEKTHTIDLIADDFQGRVGVGNAGEKQIVLTLRDRLHHIEMHGAMNHKINQHLIDQLINIGLELNKEENKNDR